jgi:hypothetical protein
MTCAVCNQKITGESAVVMGKDVCRDHAIEEATTAVAQMLTEETDFSNKYGCWHCVFRFPSCRQCMED